MAEQNVTISELTDATLPLLGTDKTIVSRNGTTLNDVTLANLPISTPVQTALNAKQATLVSGTNIKTINGETVLGDGDIVVSGGASSFADLTFEQASLPFSVANISTVIVGKLTGDLVVAIPTGATVGQVVTYSFEQDSVGGHALTVHGVEMPIGQAGQVLACQFHYRGDSKWAQMFGELPWSGLPFTVIQQNDALTNYAAGVDIVNRTSNATDTLNVWQDQDGILFTLPPLTGTAVRIFHKEGGLATPKVASKSKGGFVRLTGSQAINILGVPKTIPKRHTIGICVRMSQSQLTGYAGDIKLLTSSQVGLSGNPTFALGVSGATSNSNGALSRLYAFCQREGFNAGVSATRHEISALANTSYGDYLDLYGKFGTAVADNTWVWLWVFGTDSAVDPVTALRSLNWSDDASGNRAINTVRLAHALNGCSPNQGAISSRWSTSPAYLDTPTGTGVYPEKLDGSDASHPLIDLVLGGNATGKVVDVARVVKCSTFIGLNAIAEISSGKDPRLMGLIGADDFCLDFGSLPIGCTQTGAPTYNPSSDGPLFDVMHDTLSESDITLTFNEGRA